MTRIIAIHGFGRQADGWSERYLKALRPYLSKPYTWHEVNWRNVFHSWLEATNKDPETYTIIDKAAGIREFAGYVLSHGKHDACINSFLDVLDPLLAQDDDIAIIAHSWGAVIAYEGLLDVAGEKRVLLFTPGAALSIPIVRRIIGIPEDKTELPILSGWINLSAKGDPIGGPLADIFPVTKEYLDIPAVGCEAAKSPSACAHESYFDEANVFVNRDVFANEIESANP